MCAAGGRDADNDNGYCANELQDTPVRSAVVLSHALQVCTTTDYDIIIVTSSAATEPLCPPTIIRSLSRRSGDGRGGRRG